MLKCCPAQLKASTYEPSPVRRVWIEKSGGGQRGREWPRRKSIDKLRDTLRTKGTAMKFIVENTNQTLRGWYGFFKQGLVTILRDQD